MSNIDNTSSYHSQAQQYNSKQQYSRADGHSSKSSPYSFPAKSLNGKDNHSQEMQKSISNIANNQSDFLYPFINPYDPDNLQQYYAPDYYYHKPDFVNNDEELFVESLYNKMRQGLAGGNLFDQMSQGMAGGSLYNLMTQGLAGGNLYDQMLEGFSGGNLNDQMIQGIVSGLRAPLLIHGSFS